MRLNALNYLLQKELIELRKVSIVNDKNGVYEITNWGDASKALQRLKNENFIANDIELVLKSVSYYISEKISMNAQEFKIFNDSYLKLLGKIKTVVEFISSLNFEEKEYEINVMLPSIQDLSELSDLIDKLDKAFNQCPLLDICGQIKFERLDIGSNWIVLILSKAVAEVLKLFAEFIKTCFEIGKIIEETKKVSIERRILELDLKKEEEKDLIEKLKVKEEEKLREQCLEAARKINPEKIAKLNPEESVKLVYSITTIAELFVKGMSIYPSLEASKEIVNAFPQKEILEIKEEVNLLESKEPENSEKK